MSAHDLAELAAEKEFVDFMLGMMMAVEWVDGLMKRMGVGRV
jgi:hypothetical protein